MRAGPVGLVALWATATAVLTTTAWLAVQVVADEVGGQPTRVLSASAVTTAAQGSSQAPRPTSSSSPTPKPHASPSHSAHPTSSSSAHPSHSPSPVRSSPRPSQSVQGGTGGGGSGGGTTATVSKTFAVQGGTVAAACTGSSVALKSAQPQDGWRVEVENRGPEELEITFRSGENETEVRIACSAGTPVLHSGGSDDGPDD